MKFSKSEYNVFTKTIQKNVSTNSAGRSRKARRSCGQKCAVRHFQVLQKGCVWCKGDWTDNFTVIDDDFGQPLTYRHVKFCPMCGRKLDGGGQGARKREAE